jgi:nicotinamide riboside kinase
VSVAVKGPSSGGKSYLTERVLGFFPESAYYARTAMSERALAYSEEPLQHRFLVLYEAAGLYIDF